MGIDDFTGERGWQVVSSSYTVGEGPWRPPNHVLFLDAEGVVMGDGWADGTRHAALAAVADALQPGPPGPFR